MDSLQQYVIPIAKAYEHPVSKVGGKSRNISLCERSGYLVPQGFALTTDAYFQFVEKNFLGEVIDAELERKKFEDLRWEEIWDASLRIRHAFAKGEMPELLEADILKALSQWPADTLFSVRSSSPDEDSKEFSFAGIHESYINIRGSRQVVEKIKLVWASLWSDKALLYKKEKGLNSATSAMAVLVQRMEHRDISGLAFTADPVTKNTDYIVVETIKGSLDLLVDNKKAPERFKINKQNGEVSNYGKILTMQSVDFLYNKIIKLEKIFGEPIDVEWTGTQELFTVLQVRPITFLKKDDNAERTKYLTLTPSGQDLVRLADKVEKTLIPDLSAAGDALLGTSPEKLTNDELIEALRIRGESYSKWSKVYLDYFIPFANGIRNFGAFYNDLMNPTDPFEFVLLLKNQEMIAQKRDKRLMELARLLRGDDRLKHRVDLLIKDNVAGDLLLSQLDNTVFFDAFKTFMNEEMDISYENISLKSAPEASLHVISALAETIGASDVQISKEENKLDAEAAYFIEAERKDILESARLWLRIGKVSWKLRDDDNILLAKIENQLLLFMTECLKRMVKENRIAQMPEQFELNRWRLLLQAMTDGSNLELHEISLPSSKVPRKSKKDDSSFVLGKARQLTGQPSSPGVYSGSARVIRSLADFKLVSKGEVLIFDVVQPQMTFIISLAGAIVERRGGMLVHSSIIAREMGIPSVNGVSKVTQLIQTGDLVTVNGDLGIVVIGKPDFEVEFKQHETADLSA